MKQFDEDGLSELFDLDIEPPEEDETEIETEEVTPDEHMDNESYVEQEIKQLTITANQILATVHTMIHSTPDAETVSAASSLISSMTHLISEFNKSVLIEKKHRLNKELETMKINARMELAEKRGKKAIGDGNTFVQDNRTVVISQEDLVKDLLNMDSKNLIDVENDVEE
jgi:hypothetical protein